MTRFSGPRALALTVAVCLYATPVPAAVDFVTRTPNIAPVTLADPGAVEFLFNHRISSLSTISAWPTLYLDIGVLPWLSIYSTYASKGYAAGPAGKSPVQGSHDLGISLRQSILSQGKGGLWPDAPLSVTLLQGVSTVGLKGDTSAPWYSGNLTSNSAQEALGISIGHTAGRVGLLGTVRSVAYQYAYVDNALVAQTGIRTSGTVGATLRLNDNLSLAGDWGKYFDHLAGIPAWSGALQGKLPGSQHLLAFEVSNVPTNTLGGTAQAAASTSDLFVGFAFTANLKARLLKMFVPDFLAPPPAPSEDEVSAPEVAPAAEAPAQVAAEPPAAVEPPVAVAEIPPPGAKPADEPARAPSPPPPAATPAPKVDNAALVARGKKLWDSEAAGQGCAACHEAKDLAGLGAAALKASFKSDSMADFRKLKDGDLKALAAYLKSLEK
ncbi:MAG: hypothetical protein FJZ01_07815 [Candidatus Sericytochromatia bacterium]|nr:hypothetical protein [Candidatus Tanganyikabacteria bacterium]